MPEIIRRLVVMLALTVSAIAFLLVLLALAADLLAAQQLVQVTFNQVSAAKALRSGFSLGLSLEADRQPVSPLDGAVISGDAFIFVQPNEDLIEQVEFFLDGQSVRVEQGAPFDFAGGPIAAADPWDTSLVDVGHHEISARIELKSGEQHTAGASFTISRPATVATIATDGAFTFRCAGRELTGRLSNFPLTESIEIIISTTTIGLNCMLKPQGTETGVSCTTESAELCIDTVIQ